MHRTARHKAVVVPPMYNPPPPVPQAGRGVAMNSMNGMNLSAPVWVPTAVTAVGTGQVEYAEVEKMVEVNYKGNQFHVQESVASAYTDQYPDLEVPGDDNFGVTTLPAPTRRIVQTIGITDSIRNHFQSLDIESLREMSPTDERYKEIPSRYISAFYLDEISSARGSYGYSSSLYKVVDRNDGISYALKRLDQVRTNAQIIKSVESKWRNFRHPTIIQLHSIFQDKGAIYFVHAYHPNSQTLKQRFLDQRGPLLNEPLLWRILIQLLSALRVAHSKGSALRVISPQHVLLTSGTVARFSGIGIPDLTEFESRKTLPELQVEDTIKLGYLILSLASRTLVGTKNLDQALQLLQQHFTPDLNHVVATLVGGKVSVAQICYLVSDRIHDELDSNMAIVDSMHNNLRNEYENGRLLRLLLKLGYVNERPEYSRAPQWSETGDRYVLKLFRDYVFHQNQADGAPVLEVGHVISALNKLDAGDMEKIMLCSRDNKDVLVVSFNDVRKCLEMSIMELSQQSQAAQAQLQQIHEIPSEFVPRAGPGSRF